jgi:RES domain-containing protein
MARVRGRGNGRRVRTLQWYRVVIKTRTLRAEVLPSRAGRFHENMDTEPTTYAADTIETAWREVAAHLGSIPANLAAFRLYRLSGRNLRLLDLGNPREQKRYRITAADLRSDPPSPRCREVAQELRAEGYHGVLYPSVRNSPAGQCVALFLEHAEIQLLVESADSEWEQFIEQRKP